jgi:predicted MFS family arabinose efflux permease
MAKPKPHPSILLATLALVVYFVGTVEFMLAPMLAPLAEAFHVPVSSAAWLVSGYALSYAALAPFVGLLSDRLGRRRLLLPALVLFAADALVLTLAPNISFAIGFRILGGVAGAALTPTAFALISELVPPEKQAGAMGFVLFGLTLGITTGPTIAGLLTDQFGWRAPFLAITAGCLIVFGLAFAVLPRSTSGEGRSLKASAARLLDGAILRPNLCKGAWLGSAIAGFLISGEVLRMRYGLGTGSVGMAVAVFGIGLAAGNLAVGRLGKPQSVLPSAIGLILVAQSLFLGVALPLVPALVLLGLWGLGCGLAAPANTAIQASRADADAGFVLASSETMNNGVLLVLMPVVALWSSQGETVAVAGLLGAVVAFGGAISLMDLAAMRRRELARLAQEADAV